MPKMSALIRHQFSILYSLSIFFGFVGSLHGQNQIDIKFGINDYDGGSTVPNYFERPFFDGWTGSEPSYQQIFELDAAGTNKAAINSGDIIELGFFDTDNVTVTGDSTDQSSTYSLTQPQVHYSRVYGLR